MRKVKKTERAGSNGRVIVCPECGRNNRVFHFAWSALQCIDCKKMTPKLEWLAMARRGDPAGGIARVFNANNLGFSSTITKGK